MGKGEATRAAILDSSVQLASTIGFHALTIGALADRTGLSKSGLFAHFRSKEQLQLDTLDRARERFVDLVVRPTLAAPRGEPRMRELFERWLDWETTSLPGGCVFVAAASEFDDQPGPVRDALVGHQRDWLEMIATVTSAAVAEGVLRADLDPEQFAFELNSLMLGYHHSARLMRDDKARERTRAAFEALLTSARDR